MKRRYTQSQNILLSFWMVSFVFAVFFVFSNSANATQNKEGVSLKQAVEEALKSSPEFSSSANSELVADEQLRQSQALYQPSLDLRAETGYESTNTPVINDQELYKRQISLTMTQLLFDGAGTSNTIKRQKALVNAAKQRRFETAESVALRVVNSFLNVLRRRQLVKIAEENIIDHTKILGRIRDGAEHGKFNKGDLAQTISRVARAKANFESIKQSLTEANAAYLSAVGIAPNSNLLNPEFSSSLLPENVIKLIEQVKEQSPTLAALQAEISAAQADYKKSKSNNLPTVELQLSGIQGEDLSGIKGDETLSSALMVMRWNLLRGGADQSLIRQSFHQIELARDDKANALRDLETDVRNTWAARTAAGNQVKEFERQVSANKKVVEVYHDQFKLNRRSLLDLLNTQNELFISESNYINAFYSELFADFRLVALRGNLLQALNVKTPAKNKIKTSSLKIKQAKLSESIKTEIAAKAPILFQQNVKTKNKIITVATPILIQKQPTPIKVETTTKNPRIIKKRPKKIRADYFIQFGAFEDNLEAEEMLDMMNEEHYYLFENLTKRIQRADLGEKGIYYRLQAGPLTKQEASTLCIELNARDTGGCFIVSR